MQTISFNFDDHKEEFVPLYCADHRPICQAIKDFPVDSTKYILIKATDVSIIRYQKNTRPCEIYVLSDMPIQRNNEEEEIQYDSDFSYYDPFTPYTD